RLAIARAILRQAPIVILDEATAGLDPATRESVLDSLKILALGRTLITITHDAFAARLCDRVIWLEEGRIIEDGSPSELLQDAESRFARWMGGSPSPRDQELEVPT
ncbi:MAG: ATP-binding cassette, subfamily bacterial, partial [Actinomycetota bacterium]|nr:ATP-binding cassette, subfamily bacterial [Actinomycetota bacterium]